MHKAVPSSRITVVCPCFNDGKTVKETIRSIKENEEILVIIIDDGSTEKETKRALTDLAESPNIMLIRHDTNLGVSAGINTGLEVATTKYVFFIGADDLIEANALSTLADALEKEPAATVAWGNYEFFGAWVGERKTPEWDPWRLLYNNYWTGVAMVNREKLLALGGASSEALYEDWDMWLSIAEAGSFGVVVDIPMFKYRIHKKPIRRSATAKDNFPNEYRSMRARHHKLYAQSSVLKAETTLTLVDRTRERLLLNLKLILPRFLMRTIYGVAAWLETKKSTAG